MSTQYIYTAHDDVKRRPKGADTASARLDSTFTGAEGPSTPSLRKNAARPLDGRSRTVTRDRARRAGARRRWWYRGRPTVHEGRSLHVWRDRVTEKTKFAAVGSSVDLPELSTACSTSGSASAASTCCGGGTPGTRVLLHRGSITGSRGHGDPQRLGPNVQGHLPALSGDARKDQRYQNGFDCQGSGSRSRWSAS